MDFKNMEKAQLLEVVEKLMQERTLLVKGLSDRKTDLIIKRLDALFRIVEYKEHFEEDFVDSCIKEIQDILTIEGVNEDGGKEL